MANSQIISFKAPQPKSSSGMPLPTGSDIPKMNGRKALNLKVEIQHLDNALEDLSRAQCSFWACKGPKRPIPMATCSKCYAMREIAAVRETLNRTLET